MLRKDKDRLIKYNYPKIAVTSKERIYKALKSAQLQRIKEVQLENLDIKQYKNKKAAYTLRSIIKKFIEEFYKGIT